MRMLMKVSIPVEAGNRAIADGSLGKTIQSILEKQKPEAAYFVAEQGKRTGYLFTELKTASDIPGLAEPWFLAFHAAIELTPAMTPQDLAAAAGGMEAAVRQYGKAA